MKSAAPSAVHYVGYVEDDETPEMIMKKFEELEKVTTGIVLSERESRCLRYRKPQDIRLNLRTVFRQIGP